MHRAWSKLGITYGLIPISSISNQRIEKGKDNERKERHARTLNRVTAAPT